MEPETNRALIPADPSSRLPLEVEHKFDRMLIGIAKGKTLEEVADRVGNLTYDDFIILALTHPAGILKYQRAREISSFILEDEGLKLARKALAELKDQTTTSIAAIKMVQETLRWTAAKRNPKTFSDRAPVNLTVPIQINTSLDMGGGEGTKEHPNVFELKAEHIIDMPVDPPEPEPDPKEENLKELRRQERVKKATIKRRKELHPDLWVKGKSNPKKIAP